MNDILEAILAFVRDMDPVLRTLAAGIAIMLETSVLVGLVIPGDSIVLLAASGVRGAVQWVSMIAVVLLGSLLGESIGFALGRLFGPRIRASRAGRWMGRERWAAAERLLERRGGIAIFASRFLPVLHSLVPLTVGMSQFGYWRFLRWTVPACALWATTYTSAAAAAAAGYEQFSGSLRGAGYFFVAAIVAFMLLTWGGKRLLERSMRAELKGQATSREPDPGLSLGEDKPERTSQRSASRA